MEAVEPVFSSLAAWTIGRDVRYKAVVSSLFVLHALVVLIRLIGGGLRGTKLAFLDDKALWRRSGNPVIVS